MRASLNVPVGLVQMTLSALMITFAISQLLWGPVSDRYGRRPVMLIGLSLYISASFVGASSSSVEVLVAARAVQGLGMAAAVVCGRAMVRDLFEPAEGTLVMTRSMSLLALVSMSAPIAGALLSSAWGWRAPLWGQTAFAAAPLALIAWRLRETAPSLQLEALDIRRLLSNYWLVARNPIFISWTLLNAFGYGAYFGFFSASSYLFIERFGFSSLGFGSVIAGASIAYLAGTFACRHWISRHGVLGAVRRAGFLTLAAALILIVPQLLHSQRPATMIAALWLHLFSYGVHQPCGQVGLAAPFPRHAGTATALGGSLFATAAFATSSLLGIVHDGSPGPVSWVSGVCMLACGLIALTWVHGRGEPTPGQPAISRSH